MVLYQKYRPKKFSQLVNQKPIKQTLLSAIINDHVAHAYLFAGPRGTGKTTVARILAKAMNCKKTAKGEPCGKCSNCKESEKNNFVDLIETDAASNRGIDQIRELRDKIKFSPIVAKYKVYIIDEVHMLTKEAFNALLKMLEEPPSHAIFILATTESHMVPDTVLSRCQRFDFKPITIKDIADYLALVAKKEGYKITKEALLIISATASGSLRDALSSLEQIASTAKSKIDQKQVQNILGLVEKRVVIKMVDLIMNNQTKKSIQLFQGLTEKGIQPLIFIDALTQYLRWLLLIKFGLKQLANQMTEEEFRKAQDQAGQLSSQKINDWIITFLKAKRSDSSNLPQLPLEMAIIELTANDSEPVKQVIASKQDPKKPNNEKEKIDGKSKIKEQPDYSGIKNVKKSWPLVIKGMRKYNHSLSAILSHCQIKMAKGNQLILQTNRSFYQKQVMVSQNKRKIEQVIQQFLGQKLSIDCRLLKTKPAVNKKANLTISKLSQAAEEMFK